MNFRHQILPLLLVCLLLGCESKIQPSGPTLARLGDDMITADEFRQRFIDFTLLAPVDNIKVRRAVLQNMINERLLIQEAEGKGLKNEPDFIEKQENLKINVVLNAYRDHIADLRTAVEEQDIIEAFALANERVAARHLYARTLDEANALYRQLNDGATFEELAAQVFEDPRLAETGGFLNYFKWEDMELPFQEAGQKLRIGEYSRPVRTKRGYSIIKIEDRFRNPFLTETNYQKSRKKLEWIVTHRKRGKEIKKFDREVLAQLDITFDEQAIASLMHRFEGSDVDGPFFLSADSENIHSDLPNDLVLARSGNKPITVQSLRERMAYTSQRQRERVNTIADLKEFISGLLMRDEFLRRAHEGGFHKQSDVLADIRSRENLFLIEKMKQLVYDTVQVSYEDALAAYEEHREDFISPKMVNVREISVGSRTEAEELMQALSSGDSFQELAKAHARTEWSALRSGEIGFVSKGHFGSFGDAIFSLKKGEIGGPYAINGRLVFVQVVDIEDERPLTFAESRSKIDEQLISMRKRESLFAYLAQLQEKTTISIDEKELMKIESPL